MSDQDRQSPLRAGIEVKKSTTKVNLGLAAGVLLFCLLGVLAMCSVHRNPPGSQEPVTPEATPVVP